MSFRQKKDDADEYFEGFAQRAEYDGAEATARAFRPGALKQGKDEIRSNYISYNTATEIFKAEGRPDAPGVRVRARAFAACSSRAPTRRFFAEGPVERRRERIGPAGAGKDAPAPAKSGQAAPAAKSAPPLKLTPDASLPAK